MPLYNGVPMMLFEEWSDPDEIFSSDACLSGCGGFWKGKYFHTLFPLSYTKQKYHINILEMISIIICTKLWGEFFRGKRIKVYCDNMSVCQVINSGKARCEILQNCLRELAFIAAVNEFEIRAVHLDSKSNRIADLLSRWSLDQSNQEKFFDMTKAYEIMECVVSDDIFNFLNMW